MNNFRACVLHRVFCGRQPATDISALPAVAFALIFGNEYVRECRRRDFLQERLPVDDDFALAHNLVRKQVFRLFVRQMTRTVARADKHIPLHAVPVQRKTPAVGQFLRVAAQLTFAVMGCCFHDESFRQWF